MTAREKAIEAAARGIALGQTGTPEEAPAYRLDAESAVRNAAPLIESALLDRIEEAVWGLRMRTEYPSTSSVRSEAQLATLSAVLAVLTEIRQGQS